MARHRNVRSMNYSDEYDGYDDVYGHSVEDDFCVSPSEAAFMYDREGSKNQQIGAFIKDIAEEDEQEYQLRENEEAKLESCIAQLKLVLGSSASKQEMTKVLCNNDLNVDKALNILLNNVSIQPKQTEKKDKDDNLFQKPAKFNIPKLNTFSKKINGTLNENMSSLQINSRKLKDNLQAFSSLGDLSSSHLKKLNLGLPKFKSETFLSSKIADGKLLDEDETNDQASLHTNINNHMSLSDLSDNHLKNLNLSKVRLKKVTKNAFQKNIDMKLLNKGEVDLQTNLIIDAKTVQKDLDSKNFQQSIDLTKALTKNICHKSVIASTKKFNYLDASCENKSDNAFDCMMDISSVLDASPNISKKVSTFGKILCSRYKKYVPLIINDIQSSKFSFNVLSPDDMIRSYLKV